MRLRLLIRLRLLGPVSNNSASQSGFGFRSFQPLPPPGAMNKFMRDHSHHHTWSTSSSSCAQRTHPQPARRDGPQACLVTSFSKASPRTIGLVCLGLPHSSHLRHKHCESFKHVGGDRICITKHCIHQRAQQAITMNCTHDGLERLSGHPTESTSLATF